jgi:hypothetical protein
MNELVDSACLINREQGTPFLRPSSSILPASGLHLALPSSLDLEPTAPILPAAPLRMGSMRPSSMLHFRSLL